MNRPAAVSSVMATPPKSGRWERVHCAPSWRTVKRPSSTSRITRSTFVPMNVADALALHESENGGGVLAQEEVHLLVGNAGITDGLT